MNSGSLEFLFKKKKPLFLLRFTFPDEKSGSEEEIIRCRLNVWLLECDTPVFPGS